MIYMRGTLYDIKLKNKVRIWRQRGKTYSEIRRAFRIPKSTLSYWLSKDFAHLYTTERRLEHLKRIRPIALEAIRSRIEKEKIELRDRTQEEIKKYPLQNIGLQKSMLAMLYWAEGTKKINFKFTNTDPDLMRIFIRLLRNCYSLEEKRFRVGLHIHHYHQVKTVKNFWSQLLNIPLNQFHKVYLKKRGKKRFRKNFMGICFLYYLDSSIRKELMEIASALHLWYNK